LGQERGTVEGISVPPVEALKGGGRIYQQAGGKYDTVLRVLSSWSRQSVTKVQVAGIEIKKGDFLPIIYSGKLGVLGRDRRAQNKAAECFYLKQKAVFLIRWEETLSWSLGRVM